MGQPHDAPRRDQADINYIGPDRMGQIAAWDFAHGPINHTGFLAFTTLMVDVLRAGEVYGIDAIVDEQPIVKRTPALRYVLG